MRVVHLPKRGQTAASNNVGAAFTGDFENGGGIKLEYLDGYSLCAIWTGTPTGNFKLQASNNAIPENVNNGINANATWVDIPGSSIAAGGAAGDYLWNVTDVYYEAVRVVFEYTAGSGSVEFYWRAKSDSR